MYLMSFTYWVTLSIDQCLLSASLHRTLYYEFGNNDLHGNGKKIAECALLITQVIKREALNCGQVS